MVATPALDPDLVRTLVLIAEEKSFTRAAERVGRTQSAVSLQVQRLEALVGRALVVRGKGGRIELTRSGEELVRRGRELLALNDDIVRALQAQPVHRAVRLGVDEGYTRRFLGPILTRIAASHPEVTVQVSRAGSCELVPQLKTGELDLMLCEGGLEPRQWPAVEVWRGRLAWILADGGTRYLDDPLTLSLAPGNCPFRPPWLDECTWRSAPMRALERAGRRYRVVATSPILHVQQAAVQAGQAAATVSLPFDLLEGVRPARPEDGLPELPEVSLLLLKAREPRQPITDALYASILESFEVWTHVV
jgi:DNA-binding transcriptional LysR family regulator